MGGVFYSFHYEPDSFRASQVRQMGVVEGNEPASDEDWEQITRKGHDAIQGWIDSQNRGRSCTIVLIGAETAGRRWIDYEIGSSWNKSRGLLGIHIHRLLDKEGQTSKKGDNPFEEFAVGGKREKLSDLAKCYDVDSDDSQIVYDTIKKNLSKWVEEAIKFRNAYTGD